jgi:hypothetical protein
MSNLVAIEKVLKLHAVEFVKADDGSILCVEHAFNTKSNQWFAIEKVFTDVDTVSDVMAWMNY